MKLDEVEHIKDGLKSFMFLCPGCDTYHEFYTKNINGPEWKFNGDMEKPTVSPSLRVRWSHKDKQLQCHFFIRDGRIEFCSDCTHEYANKTLDMLEVD